MKIIALSDTHNRHDELTIPECDLLIHSGDWTNRGKMDEVEIFAKWLNKQTQCKNIIVIPGNHELYFEKYLPESRNWFTDNCPKAHLLIDELIEIDGIKIYGSPVTPFFCDWAWNRASGIVKGYVAGFKEFYPKPIKPHWDAIPKDINILITHGPPYGILDQTTHINGELRSDHLGCEELISRIKELDNLDLHIFGHIHSPGGNQRHQDGVSFYNAAICDEHYIPINPITIIDYSLE